MPEPLYACRFAAGAWNADDWLRVLSPRWDRANDWIQEADHIRNDGPETAPGQTYTSMVWRQPLHGEVTVAATVSFDARMAPLVLVAAAPAPRDGRYAYRAHHELVLFDAGLNLWAHRWDGAAPSWELAASWRFPVEARRRYRLGLTCRAARLEAHLDGHPVGGCDAVLPRPLYAGLTACEGINRFYDVEISRPPGRP